MLRTVPLDGPDERFCSLAGFPLDLAAVQRQAPEALAIVPDKSGHALGRCSVWWRQTPLLEGKPIGFVGHFAVINPAAAPPLLAWACERLAAEGCTRAVGPVDGNTWQHYRLVTERGSEPPFFLEPDNPDGWPRLFVEAGFTPLAQYSSALNADLANHDPRLPLLAQQLHDAGYSIRTIALDRFEEELRRAYALSLASFANNFLYSPISEEEFLAQYAKIRPYLRPDLILLAEKGGELAGFLLAIADLLKVQRGEPMDTVILKTLAVHPNHAGKGLGSLLMARCQESAHKAGFTRAIHALFHEANFSGRISSHTARVFRRYTLYSRPLAEQK